MSIVASVDKVAEWLEQNVCNRIQLKVPPAEGGEVGKVTLARPAAFALFLPTKDTRPPGSPPPFPSVCVRPIEGTDKPNQHERRMRVQLCFSAWNDGTRTSEVYLPAGTLKYTQQPEDPKGFQRNGEGWRDVWNFVDIALRQLSDHTHINGLRIVREEGVDFGQFKEQEAIPDYYPYWFAWVEFFIEEPLPRTSEADKYL